MNKESVFGLIRHLATFGGGFLIAQGVTDEATIQSLVAGLVSAVAVVWSFLEKRSKPTG